MSFKFSSPTFALTLFASFFSILMSSAHAGPRSGGGGDPRCSEYSNLMGEIVKTLAIAGQDKINTINPLVRLEDLIKVKRNLRCLPVEELDREAKSYPADGHTDLLVAEWEKQGMYEKLNLTVHEMSVLAGYENDGEYYISEDVVKIVRANSQSIRNRMNAEQVVENNDGSVTFIQPFAVINGKKHYFGTENLHYMDYFLVVPVGDREVFPQEAAPIAQGICKYLQYQSTISYSQREDNDDRYTSINAEGRLLGVAEKSPSRLRQTAIVGSGVDVYKISRFESITCK